MQAFLPVSSPEAPEAEEQVIVLAHQPSPRKNAAWMRSLSYFQVIDYDEVADSDSGQ